MKLFCQKCNQEQDIAIVDSGPHLKAFCCVCKKYIKFLNAEERKQLEDEEDKHEQPKSQLTELVKRLLAPWKDEPDGLYIYISTGYLHKGANWEKWPDGWGVTLGDLRRAVGSEAKLSGDEYAPFSPAFKEELMKYEKEKLVDCIIGLRAIQDGLRNKIDEITNESTTWPLKDIVGKLIEAAGILLDTYNYDGAEGESIQIVKGLGENWLRRAVKEEGKE